MKSGMTHAMGWAVLAMAAALAGCNDPPAGAPPVAAVPHVQTAVPRVVAVRPAKPKALGPVTPAVIPISADEKEPEIRIRLGDEMDRPVTPAGKYPGRIDIYKMPDGKYVAINSVGLESYLPSVLAHEIGYAGWDIETYKAQAVASRTFALFQMLSGSADKLWDVTNSTSSQVYGSVSKDMAPALAKAQQAVTATRGFVLTATAGGLSGIFCTYFSASNGGASADVFEARGDPAIPNLPAQVTGDFENISPLAHFAWPKVTVSKADITRAIHAWGERNEDATLTGLGAIRSVAVARRNATTNRPVEFALTDDRGQTAGIRAEEFRLALLDDPAAPKPYSSFFDIQDGGSVIYLVNGHGYGHGIGMSQWGAQALALRGVKAGPILGYYYPHSTLTRAW